MIGRLLNAVERIGNKLPDPAALFVIGIGLVWLASYFLADVAMPYVDPRTSQPLVVFDQLEGKALARFLSTMVKTFTEFPPLGVVLVTLLGVGVAEKAGLIGAALRSLVAVTPKRLLSPMIMFVSIAAHTTGDAAFVLVIPLAGAVFFAAGRHPVAGIAAGFAGVSGGFSASFIPSALDPLLQGFTQAAARIYAPEAIVNPLCNWGFMSASSLLIIAVGWAITDLVVEPRLRVLTVDGEEAARPPPPPSLAPAERRGLLAALATALFFAGAVALWVWPTTSPMRAPDGGVTSFAAPLMQSIVPLLFLAFLLPGLVYGRLAGTMKTHKDVVAAMAANMSTMGYYLVLAFFAAIFTDAFKQSNLGALIALSGASFLRALAVPSAVTVVGIIGLSALVDLLVGSASAKWALLAPIFVPMLMAVGISPELTQAAYRIGDSSSNIITPLMPYFPLVVVWAQRWSKTVGIGTLASVMLPYSAAFLATWTSFLLLYWALDLPLGLQAAYTWPH